MSHLINTFFSYLLKIIITLLSKANRNASGKRVKNILNESKSQYINIIRSDQMSFIDTNYNSKNNSFLHSNNYNNHPINNGSNSNNNKSNNNGINGNSYTNSNTSYINGNNNNGNQQQFQKGFSNNLYDVKNFKDDLDMDSNNTKAKSVSPNEILEHNLNNIEDKLKTNETMQNNSFFNEKNDIENLSNQLKSTEISIKGLNLF
jgi:hypothetical protein